MSEVQDVILPGDERAATYRTDLCGWVSRDGQYCGTGPHAEACARGFGSTHRPCEDCGTPVRKPGWSVCHACREKRKDVAYAALPVEEWDGVTPICEYDGDGYLFDEDDVEMYLEDLADPASARFVKAIPIYGEQVDADYWHGSLPDDEDGLPDWLAEALDALNATIRAHGPQGEIPTPLSWLPGKVAVRVNLAKPAAGAGGSGNG